MRPKMLDLFCKAGGASMGYHRAGFDVTGVDIEPQKRYPFAFIQADALAYVAAHGHEYDAIAASPPCQAHSIMRVMYNARPHVDLIPATRAALRQTGRPYVIENVPGAPLESPLLLCGTMFGLGVEGAELRRHRLFESSVFLMGRPCQHARTAASCIGIYGGHVRNRRRVIGVYGVGARDSRRKGDKSIPDFTTADAHRAMGIDWMTLTELSQAIPPAYTEFIGRQLIRTIGQERAA